MQQICRILKIVELAVAVLVVSFLEVLVFFIVVKKREEKLIVTSEIHFANKHSPY